MKFNTSFRIISCIVIFCFSYFIPIYFNTTNFGFYMCGFVAAIACFNNLICIVIDSLNNEVA